MPTLFLSYARGDDEPFAHRLHAALVAAGFDVWFDRVSMPSRSLTFHQEIRDAVASRDRLVLIVGPKVKDSLYVKQEWQTAYFWDSDGAATIEKIVVPILRLGEIDDIPDELKLLHCEDFRDDSQYEIHLGKLIQDLSAPPPALGKLIGVPSLPPHLLSRTDSLKALRDALRADLDRPVIGDNYLSPSWGFLIIAIRVGQVIWQLSDACGAASVIWDQGGLSSKTAKARCRRLNESWSPNGLGYVK